LDDVPSELVRLVGYLDAVAGNLVLDLVTVTAYDINGSRVMVPQRVDPERQASEVAPNIWGPKGTTGYATRGASVFVEAIDTSPEGSATGRLLWNSRGSLVSPPTTARQ